MPVHACSKMQVIMKFLGLISIFIITILYIKIRLLKCYDLWGKKVLNTV